MAAAAKSTLEQEINDITECPICTESFTNPRVLPCIHTFCLKCLEQYGKGKVAGGTASCPLCRQDFTVPDGGFGNLKKNFFMEKFLEMKKISSPDTSDIHCSICYDEKDKKASQEKVKVYCMECRQSMCERCGRQHTRQQCSKSHHVISLDKSRRPAELIQYTSTYCEKHDDEVIKMYCVDCKSTICMVCYAEDHYTHKCTHINKAAEEFRVLMKKDIAKAENMLHETNVDIQDIENREAEFISAIKRVELEIITKSQELKQQVELYKVKLLNELQSMKDSELKSYANDKQESERRRVMIECFQNYSKEVNDNGTSSDIARVALDLHSRADDLQKAHDNCLAETEVRLRMPCSVVFQPNKKSLQNLVVIFGEIVTKKDSTTKTPRFVDNKLVRSSASYSKIVSDANPVQTPMLKDTVFITPTSGIQPVQTSSTPSTEQEPWQSKLLEPEQVNWKSQEEKDCCDMIESDELVSTDDELYSRLDNDDAFTHKVIKSKGKTRTKKIESIRKQKKTPRVTSKQTP